MTDAVRNARAWLARRDVLVAGAIIAVSIAIRLPFVLIPPAPSGLNTVDELALALSVVDRWLGLPPINLCWPGLPLQFFTFVVFASEFLWSIATDRSLVGLSDTVARHYDDPSSLILTMRLISSIGGAVAALFAYLIVRKLVKDTFAALAAALIVTFLPISMQQSLIGTNDMVAAMAAAYGLISTPAKPILVGLASAAVVATKVPLAVWLVPVFVGGAIFLYQQQGGRALLTATARCLGAGIIGLISFDPYLWLEPVRSIKAVVANVLAHANSSVPDIRVFSAVVPGRVVLLCLIAGTIVATVMAWKNDRWRSALIALGVMVAGLFVFFWHSGFDYWRYMLGALVPGVVLFAILCAGGRGILFASSLAAIALGLGAIELFDQVQMRKGTAPILSATVEAMCQRGDTIWMYDGRADKAVALRDWLTAAKVNPIAAEALQTDFDEEEQVHLARWRAMAAVDDSPLVCPFHFFRYSGETNADGSGGYVRGAFTDKSLRDVRAALDRLSNAEIIDVIGPAEALAGLKPMRSAGSGLDVVTKGAAN